MSKLLILIGSLTFVSFSGGDEEKPTDLPSITNQAFQKGEKLVYRLHYGIIDAGIATCEVKKENIQMRGRDVYHVVGEGKSNKFFDLFYKVRDRYESYIDTEGIFPWAFVRRVNEGGFEINQDYVFHQTRNIVDNGKGKQFDVPINVQDMISSFFHARTMDFTNAVPGDTFALNTFMDNELWPIEMMFVGTDTIKVATGTYSCLKFAPIMQQGRVFRAEDDLLVWISNDKNKIPIRARAKIFVGSIKMDLVSYEGLANPLAKLD